MNITDRSFDIARRQTVIRYYAVKAAFYRYGEGIFAVLRIFGGESRPFPAVQLRNGKVRAVIPFFVVFAF